MRNQFCRSLTITLVGVPVLLMVSACRPEPPPLPEHIRAIKTITVSKQASGRIREFSGIVEAADRSSIGFEVSGNVSEVRVDVGDRISKEQVLAVLDQHTFTINVKAAEAELGRAKVELADQRNNLDRFQRINKQDPGAVSQAAIDNAQAAVDSARKQVQFAESRLKLAQRDLEKTLLRSPFDGVIATRNVEPFFEVARGQKLFDIFKHTGMEVAISIPEDVIDEIRMDQPGEIRFPVIADRKYPGRVTEISKVAGTANSFPIKLTIEDPDQRIRPGMTSRVALMLSGDDEEVAYLVPLSAIVQGGDTTKSFVFVYDPRTSTVKKTPVFGDSLRGNDAAITDGVKTGDIIVVAGVSFLEDGQKVKLMQTGEEETHFELKEAE